MYKYMVAEQAHMGEYRAILTTTDRERLTGEADVPDKKKYEATSRVRSRIQELAKDAELLEENHDELYRELREAVCDE